jgi:hypothetical protein
VKEDRAQCEQALRNSIAFLLVAKHDNQRSDMLHRLRMLKEVEVLLPSFARLLKLFTTQEVIAFPFQHQVQLSRETLLPW